MYDLSRDLADLLQEDKRYTVEAYEFVFDALGYAQNVLDMGTESPSEPSEPPGKEPAEEPEERDEPEEPEEPQQHVSGRELCEAIRQFALRQFGYMAKTVLNSWGLHTTGDFGEIVFNLIRHGRMRKTKDDRREDFEDVYDFETAFRQDFEFRLPE